MRSSSTGCLHVAYFTFRGFVEAVAAFEAVAAQAAVSRGGLGIERRVRWLGAGGRPEDATDAAEVEDGG
eukprot:7529294-Pyramimonas_sp.AAC.1